MKKQLTKSIAALLAAVIVLLSSTTAFAASGRWVKSGSRWWYCHTDNSYTCAAWEKIGGRWYHFDSKGWMQTGWLKDKGKWYYLNKNGAMRTGWLKDKGKWYCLDPKSGKMLTGLCTFYLPYYDKREMDWIEKEYRCYFDKNGVMQTGLHWINGDLYCFNKNGDMYTGYYTDSEGNDYYFYDEGLYSGKDYGKAYIGWHGKRYFDSRGVMQKNCWVDGKYLDMYGIRRDRPGISLDRELKGAWVFYESVTKPQKSLRISMERPSASLTALKDFLLSLEKTDEQIPLETEHTYQHAIYVLEFYYADDSASETVYVYPRFGIAHCEGYNYTVDIDALEALIKQCCY